MVTPKQNKSYSLKGVVLNGRYKERDNQISTVLFPILPLNVVSRAERIRISGKSYCYLGVLTLG